jgi:hypothetical protein
LRRLPFALLLALGAGSLLFDLTLPLRLPSDSDWAEAAGALRAGAKPGDAVQIWPAWAERARMFVDAAPVLAEEDLAQADYIGVQRLWLLSLPRTPWFRSPPLEKRGATPLADPRRFGALALQPWDLHAPPIAADLTRATEEHEVDYVARRCVRVGVGARMSASGAAGTTLHVRAGIIGERAYDAGRPPIEVQVFAGGAPLGTLTVPGAGWHRLDVPMPAGSVERDFVFAVSSADPGRPFCLQAWTTR